MHQTTARGCEGGHRILGTSVVDAVLREVCSARIISPLLLADKLGVSVSDVEVALGALLSHGYLRAESIGSCSSCPLKNICPYAGARRHVTIYYITERGIEKCMEVMGREH